MELATAISAVAKLIGLGMKGWSAIEARGFDDKDVVAIQGLLETGASLASLRSPVTPAAAAQHLALIARSFGQAIGRHQEFHGKLPLSNGLRRWLSRGDRQRAEEIELRVKVAALHLHGLGNDPRGEVDFVGALTSPLATPYYRRLWQAFSDPGMTLPGEEPPLVMSQTARREFERYFLLAYLAELESPAGRGVASYLDGLQRYRATLVRDLLLQDLASWGGRHMFGNVPRERWADGEGVPFLPLDSLYVEPLGALEHKPGQLGDPEPLLDLIERLATRDDRPRVVLVVADFGSGKSLSARMLARRWAERALASTAVSLDAVLPIYVRCAEDFSHEAMDLPATVQRAWKRQADSFALAISDDDDALAWPDDTQRVVCLLDGLDEVALGDQHLKTLFHKLVGRTTARQRFVVLSRPGALPARADLGDSVDRVRVLPFEPEQVERWLSGWNALRPDAPPVTLPGIEALGLGELVQTPILLFMVAFTWAHHTSKASAPSRAVIYERFFGQIAAGKAEVDKERHGPIAAASEALLTALRNRGVLNETAELSDAMLWLMARVAWEAQTLEQRSPPEALTRRHIDNLLHDGELRLAVDASHLIHAGLILALQADLRAADHQILFGHQSFREFLVGRHWASQLHLIARGNPREWDGMTEPLLGGRLLGPQNRSVDFLVQIVDMDPAPSRPATRRAWTDLDRETLVRWAQDTYSDEAQLFAGRERGGHRDDRRLRHDLRAVLREAALAIGSLIRGSPGLRAPDPRTLRSLLAWFWLQDLPAIIIAPGANLTGAMLRCCQLVHAQLDRAVLQGATLDHATLEHASLVGARIAEANLSAANLEFANLAHADLTAANLVHSRLAHADLSGARLDLAKLSQAVLRQAKLTGASLTGATLSDAVLARADLTAARLQTAVLDHATLEAADLSDADLSSTSLLGCDLRGATLATARLDGAELVGARYDEKTIWPARFDPEAHGAKRA